MTFYKTCFSSYTHFTLCQLGLQREAFISHKGFHKLCKMQIDIYIYIYFTGSDRNKHDDGDLWSFNLLVYLYRGTTFSLSAGWQLKTHLKSWLGGKTWALWFINMKKRSRNIHTCVDMSCLTVCRHHVRRSTSRTN